MVGYFQLKKRLLIKRMLQKTSYNVKIKITITLTNNNNIMIYNVIYLIYAAKERE